MPIKITVDGKSWLTEDLTLDECAAIEAEVGEPWDFILTSPMKSSAHSKAIISRLLAREYGPDEGAKRAGSLTFRQVADAFDVVDDDRPKTYQDGVPEVDPKAETGGPATTSS